MDRRLQLSEGALRDQMAVGEDADAVGQAFGDFKNMGSEDDGCAALRAGLENILHLTAMAASRPALMQLNASQKAEPTQHCSGNG
jgi:hypothetical protein